MDAAVGAGGVARGISEDEDGEVINMATFEAECPSIAGLNPLAVAAINGAGVSKPQVGQAWRLTWANVPPRLGLIVAVGDCYVHVIPLTLTLGNRVDAAIILETTPLHLPLVAWPQLRTGIGDFVLAECFGSMDDETTRQLLAAVEHRTSTQDLARWNADLTNEDVAVRREYRNWVLSDFATMSDSDWNLADLADKPEEFLVHAEALRLGLTLKDLSKAAGISLTDCFPMWEGLQPLPEGLGGVLAREFGKDLSAAIRQIPTEREARVVLDSPEYRRKIVTASQLQETSEAETRRTLYREMVGAPGRESGVRDYRTTLRMLLDARIA